MKRWRKSFRRVEKKKRSENIQNSKILTGGGRGDDEDGQDEEVREIFEYSVW